MYGDEEVIGAILRTKGNVWFSDRKSTTDVARALKIQEENLSQVGMQPGEIYVALDPEDDDFEEKIARLETASLMSGGDTDVVLDIEENSYTVPVEQTNPALIGTSWAAIDDAEVTDERLTWHLKATRLDEALRDFWRGGNVTVAQPDTGYTDHEQTLRIRYDWGRDYSFIRQEGYDARDPLTRWHLNQGHGTGSASVLASPFGEGGLMDVRGAVPEVNVLPLRCVRMVGRLTYFSTARAVRYATQQGVDIIYLCLGGILKDAEINGAKELRVAIQEAIESGIIVIAAAGNPPASKVVFPASMEEVVTVAATDPKGSPCRWSCRGEEVDVSAPGEGIYRARMKRRFKKKHDVAPSSGTTYACTLVAGAAAIWISLHGRETIEKSSGGKANVCKLFKQLLMESASKSRPVGWDTKNFGAGILDAVELMKCPLP